MSATPKSVTKGYSAKSTPNPKQRKDSGYQSNMEVADSKATEQKKEKPLNELMTHSIVDIYVGPESTHWPIHEKLLCYHSPYFSSIFYKDTAGSTSSKTYGLPDEDDMPFELLVGWLYSRALRSPNAEKDIGPLLNLYLMADKFEMQKLGDEVVNVVRDFYHSTGTYPTLRRVQYVYSNTDDDNAMREMMVASIARYLTLGESIPNHWANALKRNGQLALDIIRSIQEWHLESRSVPDARDAHADGGRLGSGAFANVDDAKSENQDGNDTTLETAVDGEESSAAAGDESAEEGTAPSSEE